MLAVVLRGLSGQRGGVQSAKGYSSVGRAAVSKTAGRKFEPYCPCQSSRYVDGRAVHVQPSTMGKKLRFALVKKGIGVYVGFKSDTRCVELAWSALRADMA